MNSELHSYEPIILERSNLQTISFGVALPVGSVSESIQGITSVLLTHLGRNTAKKNQEELADSFDSSGINPFEEAGRTVLFHGFTCPPKNFNKALELFIEIWSSPSFQDDILAPIISQNLGFIQQNRSAPDSLLQNYTRWNAAFGENKITLHPDGDPTTLPTITISDLEQRYREIKSYKPSIAIVGTGLNKKSINDGIESLYSYFGKKTSDPLIIDSSVKNLNNKLDKPDIPSSNSYVGINLIGGSKDALATEFSVLRALLSGGFSSRLFNEVREKRHLSYDVSAHQLTFRGGGFLSTILDVLPERSIEAIDTTLNILFDSLTNPVSSDEMNRALKSYLGFSVFLSDSSRTFTKYILSRQSVGLEWDLNTTKAELTNTASKNWQEPILRFWNKKNLSLAVATSNVSMPILEKWLELAEKYF